MASQKNRNFKLTIKDVRCFAGEQNFDIRPLTFLIGENSTGKTTVMNCFSTIYSFISQRGYPSFDFNKEPYFMGSFIDIVRRKPKADREKRKIQNFEISINANDDIKYKFCFKEKKKGADPILKKASADFKGILFCCKKKGKNILFTKKDNKSNKTIGEHELLLDDIDLASPIIDPYIPRNFLSNRNGQDDFYEGLKDLRSLIKKSFTDNIFSLAPVRSKPQGIYDPIKESLSPEGSDIPVLLSNLKEETKDWKKIRKHLIAFGKASGLFSNIEVKKFEKTKGSPFQLLFEVRGIESNIINTGYGLSQILPVLVRLFTSNIQARSPLKRGTRFLVQQPEVHLHPEAQAALASLFVKSVKTNNSFLIETHSDYILDRTRIEVRKGEIAPDQVSIIYLEPVKESVKAHNISIDKQGNLIGAPQGYRKFFIKETDRLLGFED